MSIGHSSLPLEEGFAGSPTTQHHLSLPEGRGKTLRQAAEMLLGPTQTLGAIPR